MRANPCRFNAAPSTLASVVVDSVVDVAEFDAAPDGVELRPPAACFGPSFRDWPSAPTASPTTSTARATTAAIFTCELRERWSRRTTRRARGTGGGGGGGSTRVGTATS